MPPFSAWVRRRGWSEPDMTTNPNRWEKAKDTRLNDKFSTYVYLEATFNEGPDKHIVSIGLRESELIKIVNDMRVKRGKLPLIDSASRTHHCCHYGDTCDAERWPF